MTRIIRHKKMLIALICASICQLFAIMADQYVLNLDFKIEQSEHRITATENLQLDLENTVKILRYAHRSSEDMRMRPFFDQQRGFNIIPSTTDDAISNSLDFMMSEVMKIYEIHSIKTQADMTKTKSLISFAQPLFKKIDETSKAQINNIRLHGYLENQRHLFILLAVIAQITGILSLLGYFIFELINRDPENKQPA